MAVSENRTILLIRGHGSEELGALCAKPGSEVPRQETAKAILQASPEGLADHHRAAPYTLWVPHVRWFRNADSEQVKIRNS